MEFQSDFFQHTSDRKCPNRWTERKSGTDQWTNKHQNSIFTQAKVSTEKETILTKHRHPVFEESQKTVEERERQNQLQTLAKSKLQAGNTTTVHRFFVRVSPTALVNPWGALGDESQDFVLRVTGVISESKDCVVRVTWVMIGRIVIVY
jgi:hypothetical protein